MDEQKHEAPTVAVEPDVGMHDLARLCAFCFGQDHDYTPSNADDTAWQPHDWVIEAMKAAMNAERQRLLGALTRHDFHAANIFRHYYPSCTGDWVDLQELRRFLQPNVRLAGPCTDHEE